MVITAEQLARRNSGIGSSDAPKILGLDPYGGPADVLLHKLGRVAPEPGGEAAMWGTLLEPGLLQRMSRELARPIVPGGDAYWRGVLFAHLDGQLDARAAGNAPVEVKCVFRPSFTAGYKRQRPDASALPDRVLVQVHHQMICAEADEAYVGVAYIGDDGDESEPQIYRVERNAVLAEFLETTLTEWWASHVVRREPLKTPASMETLRRLNRTSGSMERIDPDLVLAYKSAKRAEKAAKEAAEEAKRRLVAALGSAEEGVDCDGNLLATFHAVTMTGLVDKDKLMQQYPEVYRAVLTSRTHRRLWCGKDD